MGNLVRLVSGAAVLLGSCATACVVDSDGGDADGTGGTATECESFEGVRGVHSSCEALLDDCPTTLDEFLADTAAGALGSYLVLEGDGLREVTRGPGLGGQSFTFDASGALVGWRAWNDIPWGPCEDFNYQRGLQLGAAGSGSPDVHRCDLAPDALETGVLCDCPCPTPAPENGIVEGSEACLSIGMWPTCAPTFTEQRETAASIDAPMRSGCGVRTITLVSLDCAYDDTGALLGGERHRGNDPSSECPGVESYRSGAAPAACAEVSTCYFGSTPPMGGTPCPSEG